MSGAAASAADRTRTAAIGLIACLLVAAVFAVYARSASYPYIALDDTTYVTGNRQVRGGLTAEGIAWAFSSTIASNWHPLTWLSHMLDVELFGLDAGGAHAVNAGFHAVNAVLLFIVLLRMTGAHWRSAFAAALFAVHPLQVETVAWVAERKSLLSAFFMMLTLLAYRRYAARPRIGPYLAVVCLFALGLMAKPMLVTLPFLLLLLDYWPLGRFRLSAAPTVGAAPDAGTGVPCSRLLAEKAPLLLLSVLSSVMTIHAQAVGAGMGRPFVPVSLGARAANAVVSYARYVGKTIFPSSLGIMYPLPPESWPAWKIAGAFLLLLAGTALVVRGGGRRKYLPVGWLWFLGALVPVIGLVQMGDAAMADRYMYIPIVGLLVMAVWGVPEMIPAGRRGRERGLGAAGGVVVVGLALVAWVQVGYWRDSLTLYHRTLEVTDDHPKVRRMVGGLEYFTGLEMINQGKADEAVGHLRESVRFLPDLLDVRVNLGIAAGMQGDLDEAARQFRAVIAHDPVSVPAHRGLGYALFRQGKLDEAIGHFREALRIDPEDRMGRQLLDEALARKGKAAGRR